MALFGVLAVIAAGWLPAAPLAPPTNSSANPEQTAAVDARGDAVAVWDRYEGSTHDLLATYRATGAQRWGPAVQIGSAPDTFSTVPKVALAANGDGVALWSNDGVATAATLHAGRWSTSIPLSPSGQAVGELDVKMDASGDAFAAWGLADDVWVSYRAAGGVWGTPVVALPVTVWWTLAVAVDGGAIVGGFRYAPDDSQEFVVAAVGDHGNWRPPVNVSPPLHDLSAPAAAIAPGGDAALAWTIYEHGNYVIQVATQTFSQWKTPVELSFADGNAFNPAVGMDARGDTLAIWDATVDVEGSFRPAGNSWQRPAAVSRLVHLDPPELAMAPSGRALAAWPQWVDGGETFSAAAVFDPSSGWQQPTELGPRDSWPPQPAVDDAGDGIVVWSQVNDSFNPTEQTVQGSIYDAGGPLLHAPYDVTRPTIAGVARPGHILVCRPGTWTGEQPLHFAFIWLRNGHKVGDVQRYRLRRRDAGTLLSCRVLAGNAVGSGQADSRSQRIGPAG